MWHPCAQPNRSALCCSTALPHEFLPRACRALCGNLVLIVGSLGQGKGAAGAPEMRCLSPVSSERACTMGRPDLCPPPGTHLRAGSCLMAQP